MNPLKQLAGQTAVYGLGTIVPRLLNYLLVPMYTRWLLTEEYGMVTELYAYMAFFLVVLLYGMETTFFRYAEKHSDPEQVFSTSMFSIFTTSALFFGIIWVFIDPIASMMNYSHNSDLILMSAGIVSIDAFTAIQYARLRQQNKPMRFSLFRIITVAVNVGLNLYFIWFCDVLYKSNPDSPLLILYNPEYRVRYVFISNLIASLLSIVLLSSQLLRLKPVFSLSLYKQMIKYAFPLLIVGVMGMINEVLDKIIFKYLAPVPPEITDKHSYILGELGIYGANYKLAVLMTLFIQMFRYAAEPFFFAQAKKENAKQVYADVMKYFVIFGLLIFLGVMLYMDIFKYFIGPETWEGLYIVPIVLLANLFLGIFYNLSIWYKLTDLTRYGAVIALTGSVITIALNFLLIPRFSYLGAAWVHFICYFAMMIISWFWGKIHFRVSYDLRRIGMYFLFAMALYGITVIYQPGNLYLRLSMNTILFIAFPFAVMKKEGINMRGRLIK